MVFLLRYPKKQTEVVGIFAVRIIRKTRVQRHAQTKVGREYGGADLL